MKHGVTYGVNEVVF